MSDFKSIKQGAAERLKVLAAARSPRQPNDRASKRTRAVAGVEPGMDGEPEPTAHDRLVADIRANMGYIQTDLDKFLIELDRDNGRTPEERGDGRSSGRGMELSEEKDDLVDALLDMAEMIAKVSTEDSETAAVEGTKSTGVVLKSGTNRDFSEIQDSAEGFVQDVMDLNSVYSIYSSARGTVRGMTRGGSSLSRNVGRAFMGGYSGDTAERLNQKKEEMCEDMRDTISKLEKIEFANADLEKSK